MHIAIANVSITAPRETAFSKSIGVICLRYWTLARDSFVFNEITGSASPPNYENAEFVIFSSQRKISLHI